MARITVEDCVEVKNRFELVALASQRAAGITRGAPIKVDKDNDKPPVIALREIAGEKLDLDRLREELITNLQTRNKVDVIDDENLHAENQDTIIDELDLEHESIHIFEDDEESTDFEADSFDDNMTDEDK